MSLDAPARPGDTLRPAWHGPAPTRAPAFVPGPPHVRHRPRARADGIPIDHIVVALACLALVLMNAVPSTLLTYLKIHYVTTGGSVVEKFHPATYVFALAFGAMLLRDRGPVGELDRMIARSPLLLPYGFSILLVLVQSIVLGRPVTSAIDTFVLPPIVCLIVWDLTPPQRRPLVWTLHALMIVNILLGYFEHLSGHRIVPLAVGDQVLTDEWRATALFGHPLRAAGLVGAYALALLLRPSLCPSPWLRVPLLLLCIGSLFVFGGRTALVMVLFGIGALAAWGGLRFLRGARAGVPLVIAGICVAFAVVAGALVLLDVGFLDKMLLRFTSDNGSAWARIESLNLLASLDAREVLFGVDSARLDSLQSLFGIRIGIENFWIACIAQYGLIATALLTIGLACFFTEVLRRSHPAAAALVAFLLVIAASSLSFSAKTVMLAQYVMLMLLLLGRDPVARRRHAQGRVGAGALPPRPLRSR